MELYTVNVKKYKAIFFQTVVASVLIGLGQLILVKNGIHLMTGKSISSPLLTGMLVIAILYTLYANKQTDKLGDIPDFEERVKAHERLYKQRMLWHLFAAFISCFLGLLTGRTLFLYFSIFEVVMLFSSYPNLALFRKQLKNDDIIFTDTP